MFGNACRYQVHIGLKGGKVEINKNENKTHII